MQKVIKRLIVGMLGIVLLSFAYGGSWSSDPSIYVQRNFSSTTIEPGETINVTFTITNIGTDAIRGFYLSDAVPDIFNVTFQNVSGIGNPENVTYYRDSNLGIVYSNAYQHRWIFETPTNFSENNSISPNSSVQIKYTIQCSAAALNGTYEFNSVWIGRNTSINVFGYDTESIVVTNVTALIISFVSPTDSNESVVNRNYTFINVTLTKTPNWIRLEWNGTNETMSGSETNWYSNKTNLTNGNYTYKVWANDTAENMSVSETRVITINYTATDTTPPTASSAVASDNTTLVDGIDADDTVTISFSEPTNKLDVYYHGTDENVMDTILPLNNGHTWLDGSSAITSAVWSANGDVLTITLSNTSGVPTVAVGDVIIPSDDSSCSNCHSSTKAIRDLAGNPAIDNVTITGTFDSTFTHNLSTGWNLVGYLGEDNVDIATSLSSVNYSVIWRWNTSVGWQSYTKGVGGDFTTLDTGRGYWIYANEVDEWNYTRITATSFAHNLSTGWNLVGYLGDDDVDIDTSLSSVNYSVIWRWNTSVGWQSYTKGVGGDFTTLDTGRGYWIYANEANEWNYTM